tara:strand:+ start:678 stop:944 length:267 start_codon:yes stop_codon:yes gene_type:complete
LAFGVANDIIPRPLEALLVAIVLDWKQPPEVVASVTEIDFTAVVLHQTLSVSSRELRAELILGEADERDVNGEWHVMSLARLRHQVDG